MYPLEGSKTNRKADKKDHNFLRGLKSLTKVIKKMIKQ